MLSLHRTTVRSNVDVHPADRGTPLLRIGTPPGDWAGPSGELLPDARVRGLSAIRAAAGKEGGTPTAVAVRPASGVPERHTHSPGGGLGDRGGSDPRANPICLGAAGVKARSANAGPTSPCPAVSFGHEATYSISNASCTIIANINSWANSCAIIHINRGAGAVSISNANCHIITNVNSWANSYAIVNINSDAGAVSISNASCHIIANINSWANSYAIVNINSDAGAVSISNANCHIIANVNTWANRYAIINISSDAGAVSISNADGTIIIHTNSQANGYI
jgi:hypothetical protein